MKPLEKKQAISLIPLVIDGEASTEEKQAFLEYIRKDAEVRNAYQSQKNLKIFLQHRFRRSKAPDRLRNRIQRFIESEESGQTGKKNTVPDIISLTNSRDKKTVNRDSDPVEIPDLAQSEPPRKSIRFYRTAVAAAVVLFISVLTLELLDRFSPVFDSAQSVEELAFTHFSEQTAGLQTAGWQPPSLTEARQHLNHEYGLDIKMPVIEGASLQAVTYSDFTSDYKTPVFQYYQPDSDEYIVVFAFMVDSLENFKSLKRDPEAVRKCESYDDFHIRNVHDKHVVSWKWNGNWYAAISNHNGNELAEIIRPMEAEN